MAKAFDELYKSESNDIKRTLARFTRKIVILLISTPRTRFYNYPVSFDLFRYQNSFRLIETEKNMHHSAISFLLVCLVAFYFAPYQFASRFLSELNAGRSEVENDLCGSYQCSDCPSHPRCSCSSQDHKCHQMSVFPLLCSNQYTTEHKYYDYKY